MNIWIDTHIPAPEGYIWCKSIDEAKNEIAEMWKDFRETLEKLEDKNKAPEELFQGLKISINNFNLHDAIQNDHLGTWLEEKGFEVCYYFDDETYRQILLVR